MIVYVFEQHEYLISRHLIWAVLCSLLFDQQGSLKSVIKVTLLVAYFSGILFNGVRRTKNLCAMAVKGLFELPDNCKFPLGGIKNTKQ